MASFVENEKQCRASLVADSGDADFYSREEGNEKCVSLSAGYSNDDAIEIRPHSRSNNVYKGSIETGMPRRKSWRKYLPFNPWNDPNLSAYENSGFLGILVASWLTVTVKHGFKHCLEAKDLGRLPLVLNSKYCYQRFQRINQQYLGNARKKSLPLGRMMFRTVQRQYIISIILTLISLTVFFILPAFVMQGFLDFLENSKEPYYYGFIWVAGLSIGLFAKTVLKAGMFLCAAEAGVAARATFLALVYNKVLRLKNLGEKSVGELVNLCAGDAERIFECAQFGIFLFGCPYLVLLATIYLLRLLGPSSLFGMVTLCFIIPIQGILGKLTIKLRKQVVSCTDARVKMVSEILTSIRLIKLYAWEQPFTEVICDLRQQEKNALAKMQCLLQLSTTTSFLLSTICSVITFICHILLGNTLTATDAFTVVALFNMFAVVLILVPVAIRGFSEAQVALGRLKRLLEMEDFVPNRELPNSSGLVVSIKNADFSWEKDDIPICSQGLKSSKNDEAEKNVTDTLGHHRNGTITQQKEDITKENAAESDDEDSKLILPKQDSNIRVLSDISLAVKKGSFVGVCGPVGCGKSSLIEAILGQMYLMKGSIETTQSIAYVPQQAWIMPALIRDNILFNRPYDAVRFCQVCKACCLLHDFKSFANADLTEVGEHGLNISGGQKQRISLARAIYEDAELYLLDDPLSAVDSHIGRHIFEECFKGLLRPKTVILATHQLQYLHTCDEILYMVDGRITERGTFDALMEDNCGFASTYKSFKKEQDNLGNNVTGNENEKQPLKENISPGKRISKISLRENSIQNTIRNSVANSSGDLTIIDNDFVQESADEIPEKGRLVKEEGRVQGAVRWETYLTFIKLAGGFRVVLPILFFLFVCISTYAFNQWWLSLWLQVMKRNDNAHSNTISVNVTQAVFNATEKIVSKSMNKETKFYMLVFGVTALGMFLLVLFSSFLVVMVMLRASSKFHNTLFSSILESRMKFFDEIPTGRILNRLANDIDEIDNRLSFVLDTSARNIFLIFISLLVTAIIYPWFIICLVPLTGIFYFAYLVFRKTCRELKRLDMKSRSLVLSHITSTIEGLSTLHAYHREKENLEKFYSAVDMNSLPMFSFASSHRWFSARVDILTSLLTIAIAIIITFSKDVIPATLAGLAITLVLKLTAVCQYTCRLVAEAEARFISVERIISLISDDEKEGPFQSLNCRPEKRWPKNGKIVFTDVEMRYRPNFPLVLKTISFLIKPKEKVGIVGRSGAGKSSLVTALFRLVDLTNGRIEIDDVDISKIGLTDLRSKLSVIPQDPVLFIGTLRYNLDPLREYTDKMLWEALDQAHIKETVSNLPGKLESFVVEGGANFSVGERQLLCLTRALLRKSKILLLDEATASIDSDTDSKIQDTIRKTFKDCTVLTIAHRLNTVLDCDRILVMDDGKVKEFDSPQQLTSNPKSMFFSLLTSLKEGRG